MEEDETVTIPLSDQWIEDGERYWKGDLLQSSIKKMYVDLKKNKVSALRHLARWGLDITWCAKSSKAELVEDISKYLKFESL